MGKFHHPYHIYADNTIYFLTARTYDWRCYLSSNEKKQLLLDTIERTFTDYGYYLYAWVILDNHYHIEFRANNGADLPKIMQKIHGGSAFKINELDNERGRKLFQSYWDYCIRDRRDAYMHFNYIHHNPVKHRYVASIGEYKYSSFSYWCKHKGVGWMNSCFEDYPIVDLTLAHLDDF